jgi:hypothetical protein
MQSCVWAALLRHVPPEQHNQLMLVTASGIEITIQSLLRIEAECVAIKGRLSGTQDQGRVFFVPYAKIEYLGFQQSLKDEEFHGLFGNLVLPTGAPEPAPAPPVAPTQALPEQEPESEPASPTAPTPGAPPSFPRLPIKSAVLERFRARGSTLGTSE